MTTRARTTWLITGVAVVGLTLLAALFVTPKLVDSSTDDEELVAHHTQPRNPERDVTQPQRNTDDYWTEKRVREAEPAGPVAISPVPYSTLAAGAGVLVVAGTTIVWLLRRQRRR